MLCPILVYITSLAMSRYMGSFVNLLDWMIIKNIKTLVKTRISLTMQKHEKMDICHILLQSF